VTSALTNFQRIMAACLAAELQALDVMAAREGGSMTSGR